MYRLSDLPTDTNGKIEFFERLMADKNIMLSEKFILLAKFAKAAEQAQQAGTLQYCGMTCDIAEALYAWSKKAMI